MVSANER